MRKSKLITISIFSCLALSSCGLELREVYQGNAYNSPIFEENFYRVWDERIDSSKPNNKIKSETVIELDETQDYVFTSFYKGYERVQRDDPYADIDTGVTKLEPSINLLRNDRNINNYRYVPSYFGFDVNYLEELNAKALYGDSFKLSSYDSSFKNGYLSKLYDGKMFCLGRHQLARVQIDEGGFGTLFNKQSDDLSNSYFAVNFKASNDFTQKDNPTERHFSDIKIKVSFYCRDDDKYNKVTYTYPLYNVPSNFSDIKLYDTYTFFGFKIDTSVVKNLQGYSIEYELLKDDLTTLKGLDHSLMLYEVLLPYSTWR